MGQIFDTLPDNIKGHLKSITQSSGLPDTDESLEKISQNWIDKRDLFQEQIKSLDMIEIETFSKDDQRGALMLTYSGSLISLGPQHNSVRWLEYYSIKLRADVPDIIKNNKAVISSDTGVDKILQLKDSAVKSTSALYKIAVCRDSVSEEEQEKRIHEATIFLTNGFVKINRSLAINAEMDLSQFTMKSIINQIAARNDISQKQAKKIIDDYLIILESGMLLGEKVPLGKLGKLFLRMRPAQKARIGKNLATGETITIKAKPEMAVPKISFSKNLKERSMGVVLDVDSSGEKGVENK